MGINSTVECLFPDIDNIINVNIYKCSIPGGACSSVSCAVFTNAVSQGACSSVSWGLFQMLLQTIKYVDGLVFILGIDVAHTNTSKLNRIGYALIQNGLTYYHFATPLQHLISQYGLIHHAKIKYSTSQRTITQQLILQQLITQYITSQYMTTHYHTSESILCT